MDDPSPHGPDPSQRAAHAPALGPTSDKLQQQDLLERSAPDMQADDRVDFEALLGLPPLNPTAPSATREGDTMRPLSAFIDPEPEEPRPLRGWLVPLAALGLGFATNFLLISPIVLRHAAGVAPAAAALEAPAAALSRQVDELAGGAQPAPEVSAVAPAKAAKQLAVAPAPATSSPAELPPVELPPFDSNAARDAIKARGADVLASCAAGSGLSGPVALSISFAPSGRVTQALISGPPYAGTPTGSCIAVALRDVAIPAFAGNRVIVAATLPR